MKLADFTVQGVIHGVPVFRYDGSKSGPEFFNNTHVYNLGMTTEHLLKAEKSIERYFQSLPIGNPVETDKMSKISQRLFAIRQEIEELEQALLMVQEKRDNK